MSATKTKRSNQTPDKKSASWRKSKSSFARRKRVAVTSSAPPVMARSPAQSTMTKDFKPRRKTRRRFDLALNSPGVEMRLPAIPQIHIGWRLLSFFLLAAFSYGFFTLWNSARFRVEAAQIVGLQRITSEAVNTVLGISGEPIFTVDAANIEQVVKDEFQEFSAAEVEVSLPNSILITVTERVPVLIWIQDERTILVDENGNTFPMRVENESLALPVIEAQTNPPAPPAQKDPDLGSEAGSTLELAALSMLEESDDLEGLSSRPLLAREMVTAVLRMAENAPSEALLTYTAEHGLVWQDKRGWSVYFGAPENMEMKLKVYRSILDHLKSQDTRPEMISVEFLSAPYYRIAG
ncbi:MAG: hypothetical protein A2Z16_00200 [Chloroflexi bacterium RBG_16_54_18]|nr:MAG: hypothetical protein A2Z16_00200 [Chloroflexi bacterium RBG_16_54_18]